MSIKRHLQHIPHLGNDGELTVMQIDFQALYEQGIRFVLLDIDNTIARHGEGVEEALEQFLRNIPQEICLVTNLVVKNARRMARAERIAAQVTAKLVTAHYPRIKPHGQPYQQALRLLGAEAHQAIMIGDQWNTDILGASRLGIKTALVKPLGRDSFFITRLRRKGHGRRLQDWKRGVHPQGE